MEALPRPVDDQTDLERPSAHDMGSLEEILGLCNTRGMSPEIRLRILIVRRASHGSPLHAPVRKIVERDMRNH